MQKSKFRLPVVAAAALAVVGATPTGPAVPSHPDNPADTPNSSEATVLVRNQNSSDVDVVAVTETGRRFLLGAVRQGAGRTFVLPRAVTDGSCRFRLKVFSIDRLMGPSSVNQYVDAAKTQPLSVQAGGEIVLQVQNPLANSFIDRGSSGQN